MKLLDLQVVLERISKVPQATIAKIEGFARGGGHVFALACDTQFVASLWREWSSQLRSDTPYRTEATMLAKLACNSL